MTISSFAPIDSHTFHGDRETHTAWRPCPVCGTAEPTDATPVLGFKAFQFFSDDSRRDKRTDIHHVSCRRCLTLYMNPTYTADGFALLFGQAAMSYGASVIRKDEQLTWLKARGLLAPGTRYLDVGCYMGDFLASLPHDVQGIGVDIDEGAVATARTRHGSERLSFLAADFEHLPIDGRVDVITLFHVLEHLPRPAKVLGKLRALAHEGTRLVLEVPVLELGATNDINGFLTVSHLTHFSRAGLIRLAAGAGWHIEQETLQQDYNGYRVTARPGAPAHLPMRSEDRTDLYRYLAAYYAALEAAAHALHTLPPAPSWVVWGAGLHTELLYQHFDFFQAPDTRFLLVDSDPSKHGTTWRGVPVQAPACLTGLDWTRHRLLISSYGHQEAIFEDAVNRGVPAPRIHRLYATIRRY